MIPTQIFQYRLTMPSSRVYPGAHVGRMVSSGHLFKQHEPLIAHPDPRRIDLRASVLDVFGQYRVRVYQQHSLIDVLLLADLSTSMSQNKAVLLACLESIAGSAFSYGDRFSFIGCGSEITPRYQLTHCQQRGALRAFSQQLQAARFTPQNPHWQAALPHLPNRPSLVFLLSDFHFDLASLSPILPQLRQHDVIPLVIWQSGNYENLPEWGLVSFQDSESRATRTLFMRPALRRTIVQRFQQRRRQLQSFFRRYGCEPVFLQDRFQAAQLQAYFLQRAA
ncbi:MAG: VWA domain-containing protein [Methylovulum sp.]|nr:VWA domain-containing protein [Methylovulum sp.]